MAAAILFQNLAKKEESEHQEPSRLILYSSAEAAQVPKYILRLCLCIQSAVSFFGIRSEEEYDDGDTDSSESWMDPTTDQRSNDSSHESEMGALQEDLKLVTEGGTDWMSSIGNNVSALTQEVLGYLAHRHPLITASPSAAHGDKFASVMSGIVSGLKAAGMNSMEQVVKCKLHQVPDWLEKHVVLQARPWVQRSATNAMLMSFAPSLVRRGDLEVRETLGILSARLCGLLQMATAAAKVLTLDSPFWLRLELHRAATSLQAARTDCMDCHAALAGDVSWNAHLYEVYNTAAYGGAYWSDGRPLAAWLASFTDHVSFLTNWRANDPPDAAPFRLGSVSDIVSVLVSYFSQKGNFHLCLEKRDADVRISHSHSGIEKKKESLLKSGSLQVGGKSSLGPSALGSSSSFGMPKLLVEGLQLLGASWQGNGIVEPDENQQDYEDELPAMVIKLMKGTSPKTGDWYLCPLIIAYPDAFGADVAEPPVARVFVRTAMNPTLCTLRGVRLVSHA